MSDQHAITVEGIGKRYQVGLAADRHRTFREAVTGAIAAPFQRFKRLAGRTRDDAFWALRDVSFDVEPGEVVGIIGRNGAGKSTLLKILSRITEPTEGQAVIRGRVSSLLEVGTGFHQELTGRENMFLNAAILGMRRSEVLAKFEDIVDFAGVGKFLDTPIKRYSSGMKVRLAFAVAAHLEPEILIIDEVLAVGDQEFQNRCLGKMNEVAQSGRTVLFVSHNMAAVDALCTKGVWLKGGEVQRLGGASDIIEAYVADGVESSAGGYQSGEGLVRYAGLTVDGEATAAVGLGEDAAFRLRLHADDPLENLTLALGIHDSLGRRVVTAHTQHQYGRPINCSGPLDVDCVLPDLRLAPAQYDVDVMVSSGSQSLARVESAFRFEVTPRDVYGTGTLPKSKNAAVHPDIEWSVSVPSLGRREPVGA